MRLRDVAFGDERGLTAAACALWQVTDLWTNIK